MANEIVDSINNTVKARATSHLYGVFILTLIAINWDFFYAALFVSEEIILEQTGLLHHEFLSQTFLDLTSPEFYLKRLLLPIAVTWLLIWVAPRYLLIYAFKKEEEFKADKRIVIIQQQKRVEQEQKKLEEANIETLIAAEEKTQKEKEVKNIEKTDWASEYEDFKSTKIYTKFDYIIEAIYEYGGNIEFDNFGNIFQIPQDVLVYAHTNDLVTLDKSKSKIELTEKGKFFVRQYSLERENK